MRILVIGATGTVGKNVVRALSTHHDKVGQGHQEIISASLSSTEHPVDCRDDASVAGLFDKVGRLDPVVSIVGGAKWASATDAGLKTYASTVNGKLLCQVRITLAARGHVRPCGSLTLTSGVVGNFAFPGGSPSAIANMTSSRVLPPSCRTCG